MSDSESIHIPNDEALVLFGLLSRFVKTGILSIDDGSELTALRSLQRVLELKLIEPFPVDYEVRLSEAQTRLRVKGTTDSGAEKLKGRLACWLEPEQLEFLANEWRKIPEDAPDSVRDMWSKTVFRIVAALHKAGIQHDPEFPTPKQNYTTS